MLLLWFLGSYGGISVFVLSPSQDMMCCPAYKPRAKAKPKGSCRLPASAYAINHNVRGVETVIQNIVIIVL